MKKLVYIKSADEAVDTRLDDGLKQLSDDFDYLASGLEKLGRNGANSTNDALSILELVSADIQKFISQVADALVSQSNE